MQAWAAAMTLAAVAIAVLSLLALLRQRDKGVPEVLFAVVSGSLAISLMSPWAGAAPAWVKWAAAIGGSATCNGFWLVSRSLFRGEGGVQGRHVLLAAGVALLIALHRGSAAAAQASVSVFAVALDAMLTLASSSLLVLSFLEALRGWSAQWPAAERQMRLVFLVLYGGTVLSTTLLGALADKFPGLASSRAGLVATCASAMIVFTHLALRHRRRVPLAATSRPRRAADRLASTPCEDDARLAGLLRHHLEVRQVYREPELKVAELASRLGTVEHRLSRIIAHELGDKNFNQMLNRHRVAHACRLLATHEGFESVLHVSGESGFASLGPFNRAFKSIMGCTPTAYRAACLRGMPPVTSAQGLVDDAGGAVHGKQRRHAVEHDQPGIDPTLGTPA